MSGQFESHEGMSDDVIRADYYGRVCNMHNLVPYGSGVTDKHIEFEASPDLGEAVQALTLSGYENLQRPNENMAFFGYMEIDTGFINPENLRSRLRCDISQTDEDYDGIEISSTTNDRVKAYTTASGSKFFVVYIESDDDLFRIQFGNSISVNQIDDEELSVLPTNKNDETLESVTAEFMKVFLHIITEVDDELDNFADGEPYPVIPDSIDIRPTLAHAAGVNQAKGSLSLVEFDSMMCNLYLAGEPWSEDGLMSAPGVNSNTFNAMRKLLSDFKTEQVFGHVNLKSKKCDRGVALYGDDRMALARLAESFAVSTGAQFNVINSKLITPKNSFYDALKDLMDAASDRHGPVVVYLQDAEDMWSKYRDREHRVQVLKKLMADKLVQKSDLIIFGGFSSRRMLTKKLRGDGNFSLGIEVGPPDAKNAEGHADLLVATIAELMIANALEGRRSHFEYAENIEYGSLGRLAALLSYSELREAVYNAQSISEHREWSDGAYFSARWMGVTTEILEQAISESIQSLK